MVKTLILCVDRDDDVGEKGRVQTPAIGRRRCLEAALALGLADPEDSDTNALLAAIHLFDTQVQDPAAGPDQVEVALVAGDRRMGLRADTRLSQQVEDVLAQTRADHIVLVSDGAEDEQILPILQSRAKVLHVHRSVVKQAPRLEGFYYVVTRILDDPKQARRFVLPVAVLMLFWGVSFLLGVQQYAWGATLAFTGLWLLVHAMKWDEPVGRFLADVGRGLRSGKLTLLAFLAFIALTVYGIVLGYQAWDDRPIPADVDHAKALARLEFMDAFLPYFLIGLLVLATANLVQAGLREGTRLRHWTAILTIVSLGLIAIVAVQVAFDMLGGKSALDALSLDRAMLLGAGLTILVGGAMVVRYVRAFLREPGPRARVGR